MAKGRDFGRLWEGSFSVLNPLGWSAVPKSGALGTPKTDFGGWCKVQSYPPLKVALSVFAWCKIYTTKNRLRALKTGPDFALCTYTAPTFPGSGLQGSGASLPVEKRGNFLIAVRAGGVSLQ